MAAVAKARPTLGSEVAIGRAALLAIVVLLPLMAHAQRIPTLTEQKSPGDDLPTSTTNGPLVDQKSGVTPQGALNAQTFSSLANSGGVAPDWNKLTADGSDDAPSIQRVINAICSGTIKTNRLHFLPRHYAINSKITQPCLVHWYGEDYIEQVGAAYTGTGTWLDIGASFIAANPTTGAPIQISGGYGSIFENFGIDEPWMTPPPTALLDSSGRTIGWSPPTWTPAAYPYVFNVEGSPGNVFRHLMFNGVNAGIISVASGRTYLEDIRGQAFSNLINIQQSYDIDRINDIHFWPYWSAADPVLQYQQANAAVLVLYRVDTPFIDKFFGFAVKAGIMFGSESAGVATGVQAGVISCDSAKYCLWNNITSGLQNTGQFANIRSYGALWTTVYAEPTTTAASRTDGSLTTLTVNSTAGIGASSTSAGTGVSGPGVAAGARVVSVKDATHFVIKPASTVASGVQLVVNPPQILVPGSSMVELDGSSILQIGSMENFGSDLATVNFNDATTASNITVGSVFVHEDQMSPNSVLAKFTASANSPSLLTLSMPPMLSGTVVGWKLTNISPHGTGVGVLQWPTPVIHH